MNMTSVIPTLRKKFELAGTTILAALVLSSCLKNNNDTLPAQPVAGLMAFNLAPDQPSIGFAVDGNQLTNALAFTNYTGTYLQVSPGTRLVQAYDFRTGAKVTEGSTSFEEGKYYTNFFVGNDSSYQNFVVKDDIDTLKAIAGKSFVRFVNAVPDTAHASLITISAGSTPVFNQQAAFKTVSPFVEVSAGDLSVVAKNDFGVDVTRTVSLEANNIYTVLLLGSPGSTATPVQIKYIANGNLGNPTGKSSTTGRSVSLK